MKIRNRVALKALGFFGSHFLNLWLGTVRYRYRPLGPSLTPDGPQRFIYALWHEHMLILAKQYQHRRLSVMISTHADGQLITEVIRHLGFHAARGSSTREGAAAIREMLRRGKTGSLAITPDGPRGPRRQVQPGLIYLAAKTGFPIAPIGIAYTNAYRLRSWDRFAVPLPFSAALCVTTHPVTIPEWADRRDLVRYRHRVQELMDHADAVAERLAEQDRRANLLWSAVTPSVNAAEAEQRRAA